MSILTPAKNGMTREDFRKLKEDRKDPNAMIIDEKTHKLQLRKIKPTDIPQESFEKEYENKTLHLLGRNLDGVLWVILPHLKLEANQTPLDYWIAKHCAEEVRETYGISSSTWHKIGIGIFVVLIIAIIIVTFLIVTATSGGAVA